MNNLFDIKGNVTVITGGTGVLGRAIAKYLALNGAKVIILGRKEEVGNAIVAEIRAEGGECEFMKTFIHLLFNWFVVFFTFCIYCHRFNHNWCKWFIHRICAYCGNIIYCIYTFYNFTKCCILAIKMWRIFMHNEEL